MLERIREFLLYGDTKKEEYDSIRDKIESSNRVNSRVFGTGAVVLISIMFALSFAQDGLASTRFVYLTGVGLALVLVTVSLLSSKFPFLTYVAAYLAVSMFLIYGILIATVTRPEEMTVTFMVLLIFVPLIFVDRPLRMVLSIVFYVLLFVFMATRRKTGAVLAADLADAAMFGILSVFSTSVIYRMKIRGYVLEHKLNIMSMTDQLTNLHNRNCYEQRLAQYPQECRDSLCCVYIDMNGLHELNNKNGHRAGDEMLKFTADCVRDAFGSRDSYRIGGDEFVAFAADVPQAEIERRIAQIERKLSETGYLAAIGYAFHDGASPDIKALIDEAEAKMFRAKADYYRVHERRSGADKA